MKMPQKTSPKPNPNEKLLYKLTEKKQHRENLNICTNVMCNLLSREFDHAIHMQSRKYGLIPRIFLLCREKK